MALTLGKKLITVMLLVLGTWISKSLCRPLLEESFVERNEQWMTQHGRNYVDDAEKKRRLKIFKDNVEYIDKVNNQGNRTYRLSVNEFADLTNEEFIATHTGYKISTQPSSSPKNTFRYGNLRRIPMNMDWREKGAVTPIKGQGQYCAVAAVEGIYQIKTGATRPEQVQSRWATIARILAKNLVLFVVLAGLAQLVYRLALKPNLDESGNGNAFVRTHMEFEGRIAEMEAFLKKTAKMMQVQVDVVDRKIDNEIGGLKKEFAEKIEDRSGILKELEAKSENLEKSVSELKSKSVEWLSKEEFEKIYEDLKTARSKEYGGDGEGSLDEIRAYAREMIEREIEKHAADGLGRVDYALATGGGSVVKHSEPFSAGKGGNWFLKGGRSMVPNNADKMLRPSFGEPGQCFALSGSSGFVQIKLRTGIVPEAVTLEHVAQSVAYDRSSAPKDCRVSGWLQGHNMDVAVETEQMFLLTEFTYDLEKSNAQTFNVLDSVGSGIVDTVRLDFTSNHGSPSHTCIYRFRVHGREPDSVSMMAM